VKSVARAADFSSFLELMVNAMLTLIHLSYFPSERCYYTGDKSKRQEPFSMPVDGVQFMSIFSYKVEPMSLKTQWTETSATEIKRRFNDIFLEHWQHLHGFLTRMVGDPAEAEDLALEAFLRLYQNADSNDREFNIGGWLYRAASNLGLNAIRSRKRREQYELTSGMQTVMENEVSGPAEIFAVEESRFRVRLVLGEMNPRQAQILVLRYSGLAYQEIAHVMDVSATSVGPLLSRAENEFEKRFRTQFPEGGG
jgi:RNA polymerase sigma-70 factor, ECF subfamily